MRSPSISRLLLLLVLLALPAQAGEPAELGVKDILSRVHAAYADAGAVRVSLKQTTSGPSYFDPLVQTGSFLVQKPDRIRWAMDYQGNTTTWRSDGTTLWVEQPADKTVQVFKHVGPQIRRYIRFLTGMGDVGEDFATQVVRAGPEAVEGMSSLRLTPATPDGQIKHIYVHFNAAFHLQRVVMTTPFGDRTQMDLSDLDLSAEVPEGAFQWQKKDGWHVVPMD